MVEVYFRCECIFSRESNRESERELADRVNEPQLRDNCIRLASIWPLVLEGKYGYLESWHSIIDQDGQTKELFSSVVGAKQLRILSRDKHKQRSEQNSIECDARYSLV